MRQGKAHDAALVRALGPWQATGVLVSTLIGTGVFLVAAPMARAAGSVHGVMVAWLIGTVIAFAGMSCFAELGAAMPMAGGLFTYLTRGLGPIWGFLFGWADAWLISPAGSATLAAGFMRFAGFLLPGLGRSAISFTIGHHLWVLPTTQPLAASVILVLTALNTLRIDVGGGIQLVLGGLKVAAIGVIIVAGEFLAGGATGSPGPADTAGGTGPAFLSFAALIPVMWAYNGFQMLGNLGAEVRDPERNIPRALVRGTLIVSALYCLVNLAYFHVLSFSAVAHSQAVASDAMRATLGAEGANWLTLAMCMSALASLHAVLMEGARVPYAMSRNGLFFSFAGIVQARSRSPVGALLFEGTLGSVIALTGTFEQLFTFYVSMMWSFTALGALAVMRLRTTAPELPRPYRVWGYPITPWLFILASMALTVSLWISQPWRSALGLAVTLAGLPFYFKFRARRPSLP